MATEQSPHEEPGPTPKHEQLPELTSEHKTALKRANLTPKQRLWIAMKPRATRTQILVALLCASLGFALVVQLQVAQQDEFASLRQSDLVNLLDDVTQRTSELEADLVRLRSQEAELESGSQSNMAALEAARENAQVQGILSGRLPAEGPGISIGVYEGGKELRAATLFNILEELRNAGAEAIEVNGLRMVASSHFVDLGRGGIEIDGVRTQAPYLWKAIGDPNTLQPALEIPGGALSSVRSSDATVAVDALDKVQIVSTVEVRAPKFAVPLETP